MNVLKTIPTRTVNKVYETIRTFLWGNNPRNATEILTASKNQRGLRLCDLYNKDKALKAQWVNGDR